MKDRVQRFWYFITSPNYSRTLGVLAFLVVALTIPLTLGLVERQTRIQQQASEQLPSDPQKPGGNLEIFNARGDTLIPAGGFTNSTVQLRITAPEGSTLGQVKKDTRLSNNSENLLVKKAYASHCSTTTHVISGGVRSGSSGSQGIAGARVCLDPGAAGDTVCDGKIQDTTEGGSGLYIIDNAPSTDGGHNVYLDPASLPPGVTITSENPVLSDTCTNAIVNFTVSVPAAPTNTPTPTLPANRTAQCTGLTVLSPTVRSGDPVSVSPNFTGQAAAIQYWIADNSSIGSNNSDAAAGRVSWNGPTIVRNPISRQGDGLTITQGLQNGDHLILMQLLDSQGNILDGAENDNCLSYVTIDGVATTPVPTDTPATGNPIIGIDIQNTGTPGTGETARSATQIRDHGTLQRILKHQEKYPWDIYLPKFDQPLTEQDRTVEITFWKQDGSFVKTWKTIRYAPFVMRFDTGIVNQAPRAGQPLHVFVYGNLPATNVRVVSPSGATTLFPDGGVVSPVDPATQLATTPTIAWRFVIPGDKLVAGRNIFTFLSDPTGPDAPDGTPRVTEAVDVLAAGGPPSATVTPVGPTPTATPVIPTTGPGTPTSTPRPSSTPTVTTRPTTGPGTPTVTSRPTATGTPRVTATPTVSPTHNPAGVRLSFSVNLQQIGKGALDNPSPVHPRRDVIVCIYPATATTANDTTCANGTRKGGTITYDSVTGLFKNTNFDLGTFIPAAGQQYKIFLSVPKYLRKNLTPTATALIGGTTPNTITGTPIIKVGDINANNRIDSGDYSEFVRCFIAKHRQNQETEQCINTADLNDDGHVDTVLNFLDYRTIARFFSDESGD